MSRVPQVIVTLSPQGELVAELPGPNGQRRRVDLSDGNAEATLSRILHAQQLDHRDIGEDGAPTAAQVKHWEKHQTFPGAGCRFCAAEGRLTTSPQRKRRIETERRPDGVEIRRFREGQFGSPPAKAVDLDKLGL